MNGHSRGVTTALIGAVLTALTLVALAGASTTTLPGGTSLSVTITAPATGTTVAQAPFTVTGTAAIGAAAPIANTLLLTVLDISGSTTQNVPGATCGNQNIHDGQANTILDCELAAAKALNDAAVAAGTVFRAGIIGFGGASGTGSSNDAQIADLSRAAGEVALIAPGSITGPPGVEDVDEVLSSAGIGSAPFATTFPGNNGFSKFTLKQFFGNTNYWAAVRRARELAATIGTPNKVVVMLSDGASTRGGPGGALGTTALQAFSGPPSDPSPPRFFTFAVGPNADCVTSSSFGDLQDIADASGGTCQEIDDPADAAAVIPGAIASSLTAVQVSVDGGPPAAATVTPALPQTGPASVTWSFAAPALAPGPHEICATASGSDGGGAGTTPAECITVIVKAPPVADAGPDRTTTEGTPVAMGASPGDGIPTWSFSGGTGTCAADNVHLPAASVTCTDDGGYTATWTIDDQLNPAVSDTASLTVLNVPPSPTLSLSPGPYPLAQAVSASTAIADPGADTHTCSIDWGDGATTGGCGGAHTYAAGGSYTVTVTATDDDGGVGTDAKSLTVDAPPAVAAGGDRSGLEGALVALGGSVADDGAAASTWSAAAGAGVDPGASCSFTNPASPVTSISCTDDGTWTLTLRADDGVNPPVSDTLTLTLGNADPTIAITAPPAGASPLAVSFSAAVADPGANDVLTCTIAWGDSSSSAGTVSGGVCSATHAYAAGTVAATLTATVTDDDGGSASASRSLTFNRAPVCAGVDSSLDTLWPPNHAMRLIVLGGATDPDGDALTYAITSVRQDEPLNSGGDGDTSPDALLGANGALWLRAERSGTGDGRVYTIAFGVSDGNASCTGSVQVSVPHSAKKAAVPTPGPGYDSLG